MSASDEATRDRIPRADLAGVFESALRGHENRNQCVEHFNRHVGWRYPKKRAFLIEEADDVIRTAIWRGCPATCDAAPPVVGGRDRECLAAISEHKLTCADCQDLLDLRADALRCLARAFERYGQTGEVTAPDQRNEPPPGALRLRCIVCGGEMVAQRKSKTTCSDACRQRLVTMRRQASRASRSQRLNVSQGA